MKRTVETIIDAYAHVPPELRGIDGRAALAFHGWLFGLVLDVAEPRQRTVLEALAERGELSTEQLIVACAEPMTPQRMGSTLSRLRKLGLVWTIRSWGVAYHDLHGWARIGAPMWKAQRGE